MQKGKMAISFLIFGCIGLIIEIFSRAFGGDMVGYKDISHFSLMGYTSLWTIFVYGLGGLVISIINDIPSFFKLKMIWQSLISGFIIIGIEFISGIILNILLGLNLWDYSHKFINVYGQICLSTSILWILFSPIFIWTTDLIGYLVNNEKWKYNILDNYIDIIKRK